MIVERDVEAGQEQVSAAEKVDNPYSDTFNLPPLKLLVDTEIVPIDEERLQSMAEKLERKFGDLASKVTSGGKARSVVTLRSCPRPESSFEDCQSCGRHRHGDGSRPRSDRGPHSR